MFGHHTQILRNRAVAGVFLALAALGIWSGINNLVASHSLSSKVIPTVAVWMGALLAWRIARRGIEIAGDELILREILRPRRLAREAIESIEPMVRLDFGLTRQWVLRIVEPGGREYHLFSVVAFSLGRRTNRRIEMQAAHLNAWRASTGQGA
jgi:hypothetical protein